MGLRLIRNDININFIGVRKIAFAISGFLILLGLGSLLFKGGPRYGIDFAGGIMVQVSFEKDTPLESIKDSLKGAEIPDLVVQRFGMEGGKRVPDQDLRRRPEARRRPHRSGKGLYRETQRQRLADPAPWKWSAPRWARTFAPRP